MFALHIIPNNKNIMLQQVLSYSTEEYEKRVPTKRKKFLLINIDINIYLSIYQSIYLCSDYLKKFSIQINVATDEGNSQNEIGH